MKSVNEMIKITSNQLIQTKRFEKSGTLKMQEFNCQFEGGRKKIGKLIMKLGA